MSEHVDKILALFTSELNVINVGSRLFANALDQQGVKVQQVDWKPVAGGDKEMQDLLAMLGGLGD